MDEDSLSPQMDKMVHDCNPRLTVCGKCGKFPTSGKYSREYPWLVEVRCDECPTEWLLCRLCSSVTSRMTGKKLAGHHKRKHSELSMHLIHANPDVMLPVHGTQEGNICVLPNARNDSVFLEAGLCKLPPGDPSIWASPSSDEYFASVGSKSGAAKLAAMSIYKSSDHHAEIPPCEVLLFVMIGKLVSTLTIGERTQLAQIFEQVEKCHENKKRTETKKNEKGEPKYWFPTPPSDINLMRSRYYDGKYALFQNLPHPPVSLLTDGLHSYVRLTSIVAHHIGFNLPFDEITGNEIPASGVHKISDSPRAKMIGARCFELRGPNKKVFVLGLYEWMDDFDPMSKCMQNRYGAWLKTVTICADPAHSNSSRNTYVVSMGPKGADHSEVEKLLGEDLAILCRPEQLAFRVGVTGSTEAWYRNVYLEIIATVNDQPEKRENLKVKAGNSKMTAQFGRSFELSTVSNQFVACNECKAENLVCIANRADIAVACQRCCNWDVDTNPHLLQVEANAKFPWKYVMSGEMLLLSSFTRNEQTIMPIKVSFAIFLECIYAIHDGLYSGALSKDQATSLLYYVGIKEEARDIIEERVVIMKSKADLVEIGEEHRTPQQNELLEALIVEEQNGSKLFEQWEGPPQWKRLTAIENTLEAPMHLLFLGITRRVNLDVKEWTTFCGMKKSFSEYGKGILESLDSLGTSNWCSAMPHTKESGKSEFVGWVSSNFVAMCRLAPWFYSGLEDIVQDMEYTEPVGKAHDKWTAGENREWLSARWMSTEGNAAELYARVEAERVAVEPQVVKVRGGGSVKLVIRVIESLSRMVSSLMVDVVAPAYEEEADRCIKVFLDNFEEWDAERRLYCNRESKTWISCFNFMSLRNLPRQMKEFGPLIRYWEGKVQGEAVLSEVKPLINGFRNGWARAATLSYYQRKAMNEVCRMALDETDEVALRKRHGKRVFRYRRLGQPNESLIESEGNFRLFKSVEEIRKYLRRGNPLSGVVTTTGQVGFVDGTDFRFYPMLPKNKDVIPVHVGYQYIDWKTLEANDPVSIAQEDYVVEDVVLFLPKLNGTGCPDPAFPNHYCVLTKERNKLCLRDGEWRMDSY